MLKLTFGFPESSNENIEDNQIPVKRAKVDNLIDEVTIDQEQGSEFLAPIINPGEGTSTSRLELHEIHSHNAVGNSSSCASLIVDSQYVHSSSSVNQHVHPGSWPILQILKLRNNASTK
ncbi:hypothetical protein JTB14_007820 [Gonioctena quinquepunctata]|nr:hypothetical protein JTB14_007820 [Gonioctena quinquepunctata]